MASNTLSISLTSPAPVDSVWKKIADWQSQGEWMLQTKVWVTSEITEGVGTQISAFTGVKKIGILDTMLVTTWQPPHTCDVVHTGKIIKGGGRFHLREVGAETTIFDWSEEVFAPRLLFFLIWPALYIGVRISLARFARTFG